MTEIDRLRDALSRIKWVKDCGIDGKDEAGKWVNFAADERDAMYRIACEALDQPAVQQSSALNLVLKQAEDDGLWFAAQTSAEAYLQQELRKLHAAVERLPPNQGEPPR